MWRNWYTRTVQSRVALGLAGSNPAIGTLQLRSG